MKYQLLSILLFLTFVMAAQEEQLIIFTGENQLFSNEVLPKLENFAKDEGITIFKQDHKNGLPETITTTPAVVFRNAKGKAIYSGRYTEFNSLINFVRSSRIVPQRSAIFTKKKVFVWKEGRAKIASPLKLTEAKGNLPESQESFNKKAIAALDKGMSNFDYQDEVGLERSDRAFYVDVHPYVNKGYIYLTLEIYSQFSCIDPIYSNKGNPISGQLSNYEALFETAGQLFDEQIQKAVKQSTIGDSYLPIASNVPTKSLEELKIPLPVGSNNNLEFKTPDFPLPLNWEYAGSLDEKVPALSFRFMEPLGRYAGEMSKLEGSLSLDKTGQIKSINFEVETSSLSMGSASLNNKVMSSYIKTSKFPKSSFALTKVLGSNELIWGEALTTIVKGDFSLMKYTKAIVVNATLTPILDDTQSPVLIVQVDFQLTIKDDFKIKGPDGPSPANQTLLFNMNFLMKPVK